VVAWANDSLTVAGLIKAAGGAQGGDGGFVETSGGSVNFSSIRVDTSAPAGKTGTWLVDPTNLTVDSTAAATISSNLATTSVTLQTNANGTTSGPGVTNSGPGVGSRGLVQNLGLVGGSVSGATYTGALIGNNNGAVTNGRRSRCDGIGGGVNRRKWGRSG
jgi:hypothetical protein